MGVTRLELAVRSPFRLDLTVWALRRRPHNAVDAWDGISWRRVTALAGRPVEIVVRQERRGRATLVPVEVHWRGAAFDETAAAAEARRLVTTVLGLETDIGGFYVMADHEDRLAALARSFAGMRPPRFPTLFEALVNAVACQQLSLEVGIHLLNRLAARFGPRAGGLDARSGFPTPERLAEADLDGLRTLGFSRAKATALVSLARYVVNGELDPAAIANLDDDAARAALASLPGIGRWSAEYALLRGLGRLEVLPGDDVGARNSLRRRFDLAPGAGYGEVAALSRAWWPYAGLVYFHLLLDGLATAGHVTAGRGEAAVDGAAPRRVTWDELPTTAGTGSEVA